MAKNKIGLVTILALGLVLPAFSAAQGQMVGRAKTSTAKASLVVFGFDTPNIGTQGQEMALDKWIRSMAHCESTNNPKALNEVDLDGTPSYGLFQFKKGTFRHYVEKYNLFDWQKWTVSDWKKAIWNGDYQETIFRAMLQDSDVDLRHEFPGCTRKLGLPPKNEQLTLNL